MEARAVGSAKLAVGIEMFHGRRDLDHVVDGWSKPMTVVTGIEDVTPGLAQSKDLAQRATQGQLRIVRSCGHYVPLEQPGTLKSILAEVTEAVASNR